MSALTSRTGAPLAVRWDITPRCNLRCDYCCARRKPEPEDEMPAERALEFVDALGRAGVATVSFSGGEPMLREDLDILARRAASWGISPTVNTSGVLVPRFLDRIRSMDLVKLSLDGPEETHDALRGAGSYRAARRGLVAIRRAGLPVEIEVTLTRANCTPETVDHVMELAKSVGAEAVFQVFHPHGDPADAERFAPTRDQAAEVADRLADLWLSGARRLNNDLFGLGFVRGRTGGIPLACQGGRLFVIVDAAGRMTPCDRVRPVPSIRWTGGEFRTDGVGRVPVSECRGCAFSGSLRLNVLGNGFRGLLFAGEAMAYEVIQAARRRLGRPREGRPQAEASGER